jgi:hypothetical protein
MPQRPITPDSSEYKIRFAKISPILSNIRIGEERDVLLTIEPNYVVEITSHRMTLVRVARRLFRRWLLYMLCFALLSSVVLLRWGLHGQQCQIQALPKIPHTQGLQFINASHPYLKVWTHV